MDADAGYKQDASGAMTYPDPGTLNRLLFKSPLIGWRMGLSAILGPAMLVLTTWGRKTHLPRHTMLSYTPLPGCIYVGAGWGERCDWYQNLMVNPNVTVQVHSKDVTGQNGEIVLHRVARRVTDEEEFRRVSKRLFETGGDSHFRPYLQSVGIDFDHEDMVAKRDRLYQVALDIQPPEPGTSTSLGAFPPAMDIDLKWIWPVLGGAFGLGWLIGRLGRRRSW